MSCQTFKQNKSGLFNYYYSSKSYFQRVKAESYFVLEEGKREGGGLLTTILLLSTQCMYLHNLIENIC